MAADSKTDEILRAHMSEAIKVYRVYDVSDRLVTEYEAVANAIHGSPCLVTTYTYVSTSTRVEKMKEVIGTWSSSYDI